MLLLILGPIYQGNKIDVCLRPLVDKLNKLWTKGVNKYDLIVVPLFRMREALLWTITNVLTYAILSGWSRKGQMTCPCCQDEVDSKSLCTHGSNYCMDIDVSYQFIIGLDA